MPQHSVFDPVLARRLDAPVAFGTFKLGSRQHVSARGPEATQLVAANLHHCTQGTVCSGLEAAGGEGERVPLLEIDVI